MLFPRQRIEFSPTYEGKTEEEGFISLNLKGLDMEGVTRLVLRWTDLTAVRQAAQHGTDAAQRLRDLLSE